MLAFPKKGIGEASIASLLEIADIHGISLMETIMDRTKTQGVLSKKLEPIRELFDDLNMHKETLAKKLRKTKTDNLMLMIFC